MTAPHLLGIVVPLSALAQPRLPAPVHETQETDLLRAKAYGYASHRVLFAPSVFIFAGASYGCTTNAPISKVSTLVNRMSYSFVLSRTSELRMKSADSLQTHGC